MGKALQIVLIASLCGLIGCAETPQEDQSGIPIAEPGLIPTPSPDAGTGPELNLDGRAPVKVSPGRLRAVGYAAGLEGNVTPTFRSVKGIRIGLDLTTMATTTRAP